MKNRPKNRAALVALIAGVCALPGACASQSQKVGGETHWLDECATDAECGRGACLCGVCTEPCNGDGTCAGSRRAACFAVASPGLAARCASSNVADRGVCLAVCTKNAECPPGDECHLGACVAKGPAVDAATPLPHASDYADVDAAVDLSHPPALPEPSTVIQNAPEALIGTWVEWTPVNQCVGPAGCVNLVFEKRGTDIIGYLTYTADPTPPPTVPWGPFAPATDPDANYPTEMAIDNWSVVANGALGVRYRLFDGALVSGKLTFWSTRIDTWKDWCALQTPHEARSGSYRCVPPSANTSNTDRGKIDLCRSPEDTCTGDGGVEVPCECFALNGKKASPPDCWSTDACECSATECHVNVRRLGMTLGAELELRDDTLVGIWADFGGQPTTFRRAH